MDDSVGVIGGHGQQLQPVASPVRTDDDEPVLAVLLDLHQTDGVGVGVQDVCFGDAVLEGRVRPARVNSMLTMPLGST